MKQIFQDIAFAIRDFLIIDLKGFLKSLFGTIKALLRLCLLTISFFIAGVNNVVFAGREIADYDFVFDYLSQDIDKLSYIDKLNSQIGDPEDEFLDEEYIDGDYEEE